MNNYVDLLNELSSAYGPSGFEAEVADIIKKHLQGNEIARDNIGSIIAKRPSGNIDAPKVMLAAHMDEIGYIVQSITGDGLIRIHNIGGSKAENLITQRLIVHTGKGQVEGIIGSIPPHFKKNGSNNTEIADLLLDIGAGSKEQAVEMGVRLGDFITPPSNFSIWNKDLLVNKAWDDRVGVAAIIAAFKELGDTKLDCHVFGCGTVQEEVGIRGARTAANVVKPDLAIVLEGTPADDYAGIAKDAPQGALGKGCQLRFFDPTMILHKGYRDFILDVIEKNDIEHQIAVRRGGGTDAGAIHLSDIGVPSAVLSVPVRYAHTHTGIINYKDFEQAVKLVVALLKEINRENLDKILER